MGGRVIIDKAECIGCGSCHEICPEVFALNKEIEKAEVIKPEGGPEDLIEEAMGECPMSCIFWD
jgi:ferredoxin